MENPDISIQFYRYLCDVIGTKDVVNTRRQIFTAYDNVSSNSKLSMISSGSKAEGLDIDGSDIDIMYLVKNIRVYENNNKAPFVSETCPVVMDTSNCKPGYTQLKVPLHAKLYPGISCCYLSDFIEDEAGEEYLSSEKFRELKRWESELTTHGPCKSTPDGEFDFVHCLKCNNWILPAQSWLSRAQHQWASNNVIDSIVNFGVLFVPVGCKNSPNVDLEWRISFSYAEKLLIWSFNHVQLMSYALLKILLKEVIKHTTGDLLCSYFVKTVMLWVCEETNSYQWNANTLFTCFMNCLDRLIYCVQYETCVHFFIPENNLFENRFNKQQHTILLSTLNQLRNLGWTCLLQTETLRSFESFMYPPFTPVFYCGSFLSYLVPMEHILFTRKPLNTNNALYCCMRFKELKFLILLVSKMNQILGQKEELKCDDNKQLYTLYRKRMYHLLMGLNTDAVSGWLLLSSFFFVNEQYRVCRIILSDCLQRCTLDKYLVVEKPRKCVQTHFELLRNLYKIRPYSFIRKHSIREVTFESPSQIQPQEIQTTKYGCHTTFPPVVFGLFLQFLCDHYLGNQREKANSLFQLETVVNDRYFTINESCLKKARSLLYMAYSLEG